MREIYPSDEIPTVSFLLDSQNTPVSYVRTAFPCFRSTGFKWNHILQSPNDVSLSLSKPALKRKFVMSTDNVSTNGKYNCSLLITGAT